VSVAYSSGGVTIVRQLVVGAPFYAANTKVYLSAPGFEEHALVATGPQPNPLPGERRRGTNSGRPLVPALTDRHFKKLVLSRPPWNSGILRRHRCYIDAWRTSDVQWSDQPNFVELKFNGSVNRLDHIAFSTRAD
jgi:hypothetical protein